MVEETTVREPKILIFACRWCGLIGADGAGKKRMSLPANFRIIPVECAAFVETDAIIRALASGSDGVIVMGCHVGGCRFNDANHAAIKRLELFQVLLEATAIGKERLLISFGTAHEGHQFSDVIQNYTTVLRELPPIDPWISTLSVRR